MKLNYLLFFASITLFMSACSTTMVPRGWKHRTVAQKHTKHDIIEQTKIKHKHIVVTKNKKLYIPIHQAKSYTDFKRKTNLRKSYRTYTNKKLLSQANGRNSKLKIDVSEQRVRLYVQNQVAIDAPCTTGAKHKFEPNTKIYRDKHTPYGSFKILEKIKNKRSSIFGNYYRGQKRVYHGDRRKFKGSKKGLRYEGAPLKNWMRLTGSGIGLHASKYVKRHPGTNGCIRLPYKVSKLIFQHVRKGTRVSIVN